MKFKHILLALAVPALAFLSSCGGDDGGGGSSKPKPTVTFQTGAGYTYSDASVVYDSLLKIGIRASTGDKELSTIKINLSTNGGVFGTIWDTIIANKATFNYDYAYHAKGGAGDVQTLEVEVTDANGEVAKVSMKITIKLITRALEQIGTQRVNNIIGPNKGAYDLAAGMQRGSSEDEALKDLKDMTTISNPAFSKSWTSGNGTKFVRIVKADWDNSTSTESLFDLWTAKGAGATTTITNLAANDYILVKTTQAASFNIYLVRVDVVYDTPSDNNDYIEFTYRREQL